MRKTFLVDACTSYKSNRCSSEHPAGLLTSFFCFTLLYQLKKIKKELDDLCR